MLYSYSFQNKKRDLSDVLSTVIKDEPRFISLFKPSEDATQQKHEWLEDQLTGRSVTVTAVSSGTLSASAGRPREAEGRHARGREGRFGAFPGCHGDVVGLHRRAGQRERFQDRRAGGGRRAVDRFDAGAGGQQPRRRRRNPA